MGDRHLSQYISASAVMNFDFLVYLLSISVVGSSRWENWSLAFELNLRRCQLQSSSLRWWGNNGTRMPNGQRKVFCQRFIWSINSLYDTQKPDHSGIFFVDLLFCAGKYKDQCFWHDFYMQWFPQNSNMVKSEPHTTPFKTNHEKNSNNFNSNVHGFVLFLHMQKHSKF